VFFLLFFSECFFVVSFEQFATAARRDYFCFVASELRPFDLLLVPAGPVSARI